MENSTSYPLHPPEDKFEDYILGRLTDEQACARFEEHLLICPRCRQQLENEEDYIRLMKRALGECDSLHVAVSVRPRSLVPRWPALLAAAAAVTFAAIAIRAIPNGGATPVELVSMRGGYGQMVQAKAGTGLDLKLDCTDLGETHGFRLEIVDSVGRAVWTGQAHSLQPNFVAAHVAKRFRTGTYWVRLYSAGGDLLREYGFEAIE